MAAGGVRGRENERSVKCGAGVFIMPAILDEGWK